jgi:hypothetical protein
MKDKTAQGARGHGSVSRRLTIVRRELADPKGKSAKLDTSPRFGHGNAMFNCYSPDADYEAYNPALASNHY